MQRFIDFTNNLEEGLKKLERKARAIEKKGGRPDFRKLGSYYDRHDTREAKRSINSEYEQESDNSLDEGKTKRRTDAEIGRKLAHKREVEKLRSGIRTRSKTWGGKLTPDQDRRKNKRDLDKSY